MENQKEFDEMQEKLLQLKDKIWAIMRMKKMRILIMI